jgi:hypothetical protein
MEKKIEIEIEIKQGSKGISSEEINNTQSEIALNPSPQPEPLPVASPDPSPAPDPSPDPSPTTQPIAPPFAELNEDELDFLKWIREAIAQPDTDTARETVADILPTLKNLCAKGMASREKVWAALTDSERATFSELTAKPIGTGRQSART